ncbi:3-hydroxyisobutyrate dehydrogenase [Alteracholeplasma palmae J233]|uniref:3-hydroxyisobutyrate dehydrogenase n=1 Tax=Alteracholeplasma palmae (strain ATCC 49389 / J233) TaxID=1318466 RepID=U4KLV9_ALTPJ|nr:NAD(P)-dependent oxidoreductase [Alteracholeplasma palmae]CCV64932.1 3-hydroxyisobutyrate dehydrogenase [Alteracholeplasma palmae J233]
MKIAWIGTGVMGKPMALNLKKAGYDVSVYNRTYERALELKNDVTVCKSINECVKDADIVFTIVGYPKDVKEVTTEVFKHAKKGTIIVDMTTSSPTLAKELYLEGKEKGFDLLDAPVTGGDLGAINATLSIMVGGDEKVFSKVLTIFEKLGKTINFMGHAGNGQHAKLANQAAIAGTIGALAESLVYAKEKSLDVDKMLSVISGGSATSWQAINNGPKMISGNTDPGFYIKHFLKDLNLIIEEADFSPLVVKQVRDIYHILNEKNLGDLGTQAIIKYYLENSNK